MSSPRRRVSSCIFHLRILGLPQNPRKVTMATLTELLKPPCTYMRPGDSETISLNRIPHPFEVAVSTIEINQGSGDGERQFLISHIGSEVTISCRTRARSL